MAGTHIPELRHIVDIDGQLVGIEPVHVSTAMLRALAGVQGEIVQVVDGQDTPLLDGGTIALREDQVLFFRSVRLSAATEWRRAA